MAQQTSLVSNLPIYDYVNAITGAVDTNQVTIITAETGAGKSTQVPQYLLEHGYQKVIVTQPRILAARNLSARVRDEWSERTGVHNDEVVAYRTAHERDDSPETKILYCTDGLQLVREITGAGTETQQVLVLDEIHEWNENMEVLVAWAKKRCQEDKRFKVVLMSATIETEALARYFNTDAVVSVPGRSFEVIKRRGTDIVSEIIDQMATHKSNMLVFLPGKAEIESVTAMIKAKAASANMPIIPLHGQLEASAQQLAFGSHVNGKIILTTNVAQTSVTIDDIDVVIDSGLERRSEVQSGVEGLFIAQISQADCLQRAGRAGRTKPGEYILAPLDDMPCLEFDDRPAYAIPEILRKHIDRLALRLANVGIDIEMLEFYHAPSARAIKAAKRTLRTLGALSPSGDITSIGRRMERFPVESSYARMLVESEQYDGSVQAKLAAIIGIQEVGGIVKGGARHTGWRRYTKQTQSDLIAQYDVYLALPTIDPEEYEELGIIAKNVAKAREIMARIDRDLGFDVSALTPVAKKEVPELIQCIVAGQVDQLWVIDEKNNAIHVASKKKRELSSGTVVTNPKLVVGTPFDLQIQTQKGRLETLHLVQGVSAVDPSWLQTLAPEVFKVKTGKTYFDSHTGNIATRQLIRFKGQVLEGASLPIMEPTPRNRRMFRNMYSAWIHGQLEKDRQNLQSQYGRRIAAISLRKIEQEVARRTDGVMSLDELDSQARAELAKLARIETHLGNDFMASLGTASRRHVHDKNTRRSWKPQHKRKFGKRKDW